MTAWQIDFWGLKKTSLNWSRKPKTFFTRKFFLVVGMSVVLKKFEYNYHRKIISGPNILICPKTWFLTPYQNFCHLGRHWIDCENYWELYPKIKTQHTLHYCRDEVSISEANLNFNCLFWFFEKFRTPYTIQNLFYDTVLMDCAGSLALSQVTDAPGLFLCPRFLFKFAVTLFYCVSLAAIGIKLHILCPRFSDVAGYYITL